MTKKLMQAIADKSSIVEVLGQDGDDLWVKAQNGKGRPWTTSADMWEDFSATPEVGDIWCHASEHTKFLVVGVDEKRKQWLMIDTSSLDRGYPTSGVQGEITRRMSMGLIYIRSLPETVMHLKERP